MTPATATCSIGSLLDDLSHALAGAGAPPDRGGARDLIAAVLDRPRFWPTAHRDTVLDDAQHDAVRAAAAALRHGMPFAYAVGKAAFRHLTLAVDRRVLIPRPETELLVDIALAATSGRGVVADIGTGSGAIALSLASEGAYERVIATDLSEAALAVARTNLDAIPADRRQVVEFRLGDLVAPLGGEQVAALVCNPPYIATTELRELPLSVTNWEPASALFSGEDGMAAIDRLVVEAADVVAPRGLLLLEVDSRRAHLALRHAETTGRWSDVELRPDLTGRERFLVARRSTR